MQLLRLVDYLLLKLGLMDLRDTSFGRFVVTHEGKLVGSISSSGTCSYLFLHVLDVVVHIHSSHSDDLIDISPLLIFLDLNLFLNPVSYCLLLSSPL